MRKGKISLFLPSSSCHAKQYILQTFPSVLWGSTIGLDSPSMKCARLYLSNAIVRTTYYQWRTLGQILGGQAYCFGRMTSHISIVLKQKTIVFQNIGGPSPPLVPPPKCPPLHITSFFRRTETLLIVI